jgi:hypothetical protein
MNIEYEPQKFADLQLDSLRVAECHISLPKVPENILTFDYVIVVENTIEEDLGLVYVNVDVHVRDQDETPLGQYKVNCAFSIKNLKALELKRDSGKARLAKLAAIWNSIAISTVRGMMHADFKGTFLHNAVLPIVNPAQYGPTQP